MTTRNILQTRRQLIYARDRYTCVYCGEKATSFIYDVELKNRNPFVVPVDRHGHQLEIDYIKPFSKSKSNKLKNLCTACFRCNSNKSDRNFSFVPSIVLVVKRFKHEK